MFKQLINKIKQDKNYIFTSVSLLSVVLWYLNFSARGGSALGGKFSFFSFICFIIFFFINSLWLAKLLNRRGFEKELQIVLGVFCLLFLIGFGMAMPIVVYKVTPVCLLIWLLFLTIGISFWAKTRKQEPEQISLESEIKTEEATVKLKKIVYFIWVIVFVFSLFLLFYARTGEYIRSPWTVIHPLYIYAWLGLIIFLGLLVFSKIRLKHFLLILILTSLLFHAYLLIPYQAGFGGDKWRHIGAEKMLMQGKVYEPVLFGENVSYAQLGPLKIPEVLVAGNKTSYANMWGLTIALSWLTGIDIFYLDLVLGFLLFSIFLPFLLLKFGLFFSRKKEFLFLFILMPFCFYPFQAYGSITVPMTFSFLLFLFSLIFINKYLTQKNHSPKLLLALIFLIPFLYFSYLVYLILFLQILVLAILIKNIKLNKKVFIPVLIVFFLILLIFIPALETYNHYSWLKTETPLKEQAGEMIKEFPVSLLFSKAIFPRIYGLEQDNWLYATINRDLSRSALFDVLPWVFILTPLVWLLVIFGFIQFRKLRDSNLGMLFGLMLVVVLINQMISSYFMEGNHLLSKRLVVFTSFLFFMPLAWGVYVLIEKVSNIFSKKGLIISCLIFIGLVSTTVYASGPKFQVVTNDEHKAAQYLWQKLEENPKDNYCVLANTWPLLALEGMSGGEIITGGFPYYYEYRQPERVQLFENMNKSPSIRYLEKSLEITQAKQCYFMTEERWVYYDNREEIITQLDDLLGDHENIGKVMIWHYQP